MLDKSHYVGQLKGFHRIILDIEQPQPIDWMIAYL